MKKTCLSVLGILLTLFSSFAQPAEKDSSQYKNRKLKLEEINLVSSYYRQNGNNSAVTGGIGTEKLTDLSNTIDVKLTRWDKKDRKHSYDIEIGFDHYSSASSDNIDPNTMSGASHADSRLFPSVNWSRENANKGTTVGAGISFSSEYDYQSIGANLLFSKKTKNGAGEITGKLQAYLDQLKYILPIEFRPPGSGEGDDYESKARNSFSGSLSYSQIMNQRLQLMLTAEFVHQQGYLGLPFHRVYMNTSTVAVEKLPDTRTKIPIGLRANYFLGDKIILRGFYRYYQDNWGLNAHTASLEVPVKITPFLSVIPFYRYYTQTAVDYFAAYRLHKLTDQYYTSNYDLSKFNSNFYGAGFKMVPAKGVFGIQRLNTLELRYGHYTRTNGLNSDILTLNVKFK